MALTLNEYVVQLDKRKKLEGPRLISVEDLDAHDSGRPFPFGKNPDGSARNADQYYDSFGKFIDSMGGIGTPVRRPMGCY
ncbi:MAG: hypothetical protein WCK90_05775 [archaeon]